MVRLLLELVARGSCRRLARSGGFEVNGADVCGAVVATELATPVGVARELLDREGTGAGVGGR